MSRQDPFRHIRNNPVEPIDLIPTAEDSQRTKLEQKKRTAQRERRAAYDQQHKVFSYYVPRHLVLDARRVKAALAGLAYEKLCTESSLAMAFLAWALAEVRSGNLSIQGYPDLSRRKMNVILVTAGNQHRTEQQDIPAPPVIKKDRALYLGWRLQADIVRQIAALAAESLSPGEVVIRLLEYAIKAYQSGQASLVINPVDVRQNAQLE